MTARQNRLARQKKAEQYKQTLEQQLLDEDEITEEAIREIIRSCSDQFTSENTIRVVTYRNHSYVIIEAHYDDETLYFGLREDDVVIAFGQDEIQVIQACEQSVAEKIEADKHSKYWSNDDPSYTSYMLQ